MEVPEVLRHDDGSTNFASDYHREGRAKICGRAGQRQGGKGGRLCYDTSRTCYDT